MLSFFRKIIGAMQRIDRLERDREADRRVMHGLAAKVFDRESVIDDSSAFVGNGVACPHDGVGAAGFNPTRFASEDGPSEYFVGASGRFKLAGSGRGAKPVELRFVGGVLVGEATCER